MFTRLPSLARSVLRHAARGYGVFTSLRLSPRHDVAAAIASTPARRRPPPPVVTDVASDAAFHAYRRRHRRSACAFAAVALPPRPPAVYRFCIVGSPSQPRQPLFEIQMRNCSREDGVRVEQKQLACVSGSRTDGMPPRTVRRAAPRVLPYHSRRLALVPRPWRHEGGQRRAPRQQYGGSSARRLPPPWFRPAVTPPSRCSLPPPTLVNHIRLPTR